MDSIVGKSAQNKCVTLEHRRTTRTLGLIHSDICGPMSVKSSGVACLKAKSEAADKLKEFIRMAERRTGHKVRIMRTDNGFGRRAGFGIFITNLHFTAWTAGWEGQWFGIFAEISSYFKKFGIKHERSNVETPQMNSVAERVNRTLMDLVRSMLKPSGLPKQFWAEAVTATAYVRNRVLNSSNNAAVPDTVWMRQGRKKLDERAEPRIMVGYGIRAIGYGIWLTLKNNDIGEVVETKH
ncbi:LOW QUALITY PROTEIN: hypothetical protein M514_28430, partial [Trichuris suis]